MKKTLVCSLIAAVFAVSTASAAPATSDKQARTAVKFRQSLLQLVRSNMGDLGAMAKGQKPFDAAVMEKNGMRLEQLALMLEDYFATDTRKYKTDTSALDKIWEEPADYSAKINALIEASRNLQAVAKAGDESKFRKAIGGVGRTCKGCHDEYKAD